MLKILENGVRIVFEKNENIRSATVGIWVKAGSRNENLHNNGISHFIEHMMFKGTATRTAKDIATEMDSIGGQVNAFTTKECTCYYVKALDTHLVKATEILTDMFFNSKFDQKDIELERKVIEEEISMYEDQPEDVVIEKLGEAIFSDSSYGFPVLGTNESLENIDTAEILKYIHQNYFAENIVVSICGSFDEMNLKNIENIFLNCQSNQGVIPKKAVYKPEKVLINKDIEQNHIYIGFEGLNLDHKDRFVLQVLSGILGGGMSSRLFQKVREEHGLCYTIASFNSAILDSGIFGIYVALSKETEHIALDLIKKEIMEFVQDGALQVEVDRQREQIKANILMSLESTSAKMNFLARSVLFHDKIVGFDEIIDRYDCVTLSDVNRLIEQIFDFSKASICVVGDISHSEIYDEFLNV